MKTILAILFFCLPILAFPQVSYPPASQSEVNAGTIHSKFVAPDTLLSGFAAQGGVTNGQSSFVFKSNLLTAALSPLSVSGATSFPFLNSTNWQLCTTTGATNGIWVEMPGATNFLYYDPTFTSAYIFANTLQSPDGTTGVFENAGNGSDSGSIDTVIAQDNGQWSPDVSLTLSFTQTNTLALTNLAIVNDQLIKQVLVSEQNVKGIELMDARGNLEVQLAQDPSDGGGNFAGRVEMFGAMTGQYSTNKLYNVMRIHGKTLNNPQAADNRVAYIWGKGIGNNGTNGGEMFMGTGRVLNNPPSGPLNYSFLIDCGGNLMLGQIIAEYPSVDTVAVQAPAEVSIMPATSTNYPQIMLYAGKPYLGTSNGVVNYDGTNVLFTGPAQFKSGTVGMNTNTQAPFAATAGVGYVFIGGPGGTNLYLVIKTAGGVLATNKFTPSGQWP